MEEIWKDVVGYEGLYLVSNMGNIKSLPRLRNTDSNPYMTKEKLLKTPTNTVGYKVVNLSKNKKTKLYCVHKIVAMAFLGHKPNGFSSVIDHIDENKQNNNVSNLREISHRENISKGMKNGSSKYTGVHFSSKKMRWVACIRIDGGRIRLGSFKNEYDAHLAYETALKNLVYHTT